MIRKSGVLTIVACRDVLVNPKYPLEGEIRLVLRHEDFPDPHVGLVRGVLDSQTVVVSTTVFVTTV
jgi:hypothetical protein